MEKIVFDSGIRCYKVGSGVLKFNPSDPNLYARFLDALDALDALEKQLQDQPQESVLRLLKEADCQVKKILGGVFGPGNDMDAVFSGINLLAVGDNGQRLLTNFVSAVEPILHEGAKRCAAQEAGKL